MAKTIFFDNFDRNPNSEYLGKN